MRSVSFLSLKPDRLRSGVLVLALAATACTETTSTGFEESWQGSLAGGASLDALSALPDGGFVGAGYSSVFVNGTMFLMRVAPSGEAVWSKSAENLYNLHLASDGADRIYLHAVFSSPGTYFGVELSAPSYPAQSLIALDSDGATVWSKVFRTGASTTASDLDADTNGLSLVGSFTGSLAIDDETLVAPSAGGSPAFLLQLDPDGNVQLARAYGNSARIDSVARTADGSSVVAGSFTNTLNLGSTTLAAKYWNALFFAQLDANGDALWQKHHLGDGSLEVRPWNDGYALIASGSSMDLGVDRWFNGLAAARLNGDGSVAWAYQLGPTYTYSASPPGTVDAAGHLVTVRATPTLARNEYGNYTQTSIARDLLAFQPDGGLEAAMPLDTLEENASPRSLALSPASTGEVIVGATNQFYAYEYNDGGTQTTVRRVRVIGTD